MRATVREFREGVEVDRFVFTVPPMVGLADALRERLDMAGTVHWDDDSEDSDFDALTFFPESHPDHYFTAVMN